MLADYFNNPLMPFKWYVVARTRERRLFKKVDVFVYLSMTHDDMFELLYVSFDEINRRLTRCYHGKLAMKLDDNYLIIRKGLWRKKFLIVEKDDESKIVVLSNKRKSKVWIFSKTVPYDKTAFEKIMKHLEEKGFDVGNIELF